MQIRFQRMECIFNSFILLSNTIEKRKKQEFCIKIFSAVHLM